MKIGVYLANQPSDSEPDSFTDLETARAWKHANKAFFINHGKAVRLIGDGPKEVAEHLQKSNWKAIPSGTPKIGWVNVLQLV